MGTALPSSFSEVNCRAVGLAPRGCARRTGAAGTAKSRWRTRVVTSLALCRTGDGIQLARRAPYRAGAVYECRLRPKLNQKAALVGDARPAVLARAHATACFPCRTIHSLSPPFRRFAQVVRMQARAMAAGVEIDLARQYLSSGAGQARALRCVSMRPPRTLGVTSGLTPL